MNHQVIFVGSDKEEIISQARKFYPDPLKVDVSEDRNFPGLTGWTDQQTGKFAPDSTIHLARDPDVLDTWFSSALWPFSTLGWPEQTAELKKHYPTSVLVTAHDIIFFWVARMMMDGIHFMKEVPFHTVYIHALVLDEHGQKMSKSKGNVIDPLVLIEKFGADALRFTLAAQAAQGRNIRLSESRVEGYRNFSTKLWNAARFAEMNECKPDASFDPAKAKLTLNQWIVHEANSCAADVTREIEAYRFNDAAGAIYKFVWNIFCDWYLELAKPVFMGEDEAAKAETRAAAAWALDRILQLLHPFMPYITEELWGAFAKRDALMLSQWPTFDDALKNDAASEEVNWVIGLTTKIRSTRSEYNVPLSASVSVAVLNPSQTTTARMAVHMTSFERLANVSEIKTIEKAEYTTSVSVIHDGEEFSTSVFEAIDVNAEKARLAKEKEKTEKEIAGIDKKLANKNFVDKAPPAVVEEQHTRRANHVEKLEKLDAALARLNDL